MKRTTRILTALALLCGAITVATPAVAQDFASDTENYLATNVRIESIAITDAEPVAAGETVTFEVTLADTGTTPVTLQSATFTGADKTQLPYLKLNIPFRGTSTPLEGVSVTTDTAAAFFKGSRQQGRNLVLQFEYTVRYGDLASALNWAGTTPSFGGNIAGISVQAYRGIEFPSAVSLSQSSLVPKDEGITKPVDTPSVCGYDVRIGGVFDPTTNASLDYSGGLTERLFPGVVPVTVSIPAGVSVATPGTGAPAGFFQAWVKRGDNYLAVGVTPSTSANFVAAKDPVDPSPAVTTFMGAYDAKLTASAAPLLTAGSSATYYLNIPASLYNTGASSEALTFGFGYGDGDGAGTFSGASLSKTFNMTAQLIQDGSSYALSGSVAPATLTSDGTANSVTINGQVYPVSEAIATDAQVWVASLAAGESLTFQAYKSDSENYETAGGYYAGWTRVSTATNRAAFSSPVVRFAGNSTTAVTITAPDTASGDAIFRLSSPGLDDKPIYLLVQVSVPRAQITLTPAGSSSGTEYVMTPAIDDGAGTVTDGSGNILKYTLSLSAPVTATTYFRVAPTFSDGTLIAAGATLTNGAGETIDAYDLFASFATLSTGRGYSDTDPACTLTIPAGSSTADFYVTLHNDFPRTGDLPAGLEGTGPNAGKTITRLAFSARTATSTGAVVGTNDICNELVPMIMNQAPTISSFSAPSNGSASNVALTFSFNILDAPGDYLVAEMNFGEGENVVKVLVDQTKMIAILGETKWKQIVADLGNRYPSLADAITAEGLFDVNSELVIERKDALSVVSFSHAYNTTAANWSMTVTDSSNYPVTQSGSLTLSTSQKFTVYTYDEKTAGLGTVTWEDGTVWNYGANYVYSALNRTMPNTVAITAKPFRAGDKAGFTQQGLEVSTIYDSFFYEWYADDKYAGILPSGDDRFSETVIIDRAFMGQGGGGDGDANDPSAWQDIVLRARFVREYLGGDYNPEQADAITEFWPTYRTETPYLLSLGDYNLDGVPDGWIRQVFGDDADTYVSGQSLAGVAAEDERLPTVGWAGSDGVYRYAGNSTSPGGSFALEGSLFDYKTRLRGRDPALNAATGKPADGRLLGEWISGPQWVVRVRAPYVSSTGVTSGTHANGGILRIRGKDADTSEAPAVWTETNNFLTIRLATGPVNDYKGDLVAHTGGIAHVYYWNKALTAVDADVDAKAIAEFLAEQDLNAENWRFVVDENGYPVRSGVDRDDGFRNVANVLINVGAPIPDDEEAGGAAVGDPNAGRMITLYRGWAYTLIDEDGDPTDILRGTSLKEPVIYPYGAYSLGEDDGPLPDGSRPETVVERDDRGRVRADMSAWSVSEAFTYRAPIVVGVATRPDAILARPLDALGRMPALNASTPVAVRAAAVSSMLGLDILQAHLKDSNGVSYVGLDPLEQTLLLASVTMPDQVRDFEFRTSCGMLLDEPFRDEENAEELIDPRLTSWLDRADNSADSDGDGLPNALEYYFWYYASRIAYAPVRASQVYCYTVNEDGVWSGPEAMTESLLPVFEDVSLDSAVWPAIDMSGRRFTNTHFYGRYLSLSMGRRYRNGFDPRLGFGSNGNNPYESNGQATHCKGNFWEPISADTVLATFNPLVAGSSAADPDNDGLGTMEEIAIGTNPIDCDTDNDYIPDGWEVAMGTNPTSNDAGANPDGDAFAYAVVNARPQSSKVYTFNYETPYVTPSGTAVSLVALAEWTENAGTVTYPDYGETHAYFPYSLRAQLAKTIFGTNITENGSAGMTPAELDLLDSEVNRLSSQSYAANRIRTTQGLPTATAMGVAALEWYTVQYHGGTVKVSATYMAPVLQDSPLELNPAEGATNVYLTVNDYVVGNETLPGLRSQLRRILYENVLEEQLDPEELRALDAAVADQRVQAYASGAVSGEVTYSFASAPSLVRYTAPVSRQVMLRDHEVYRAFGFDPMTGWTLSLPSEDAEGNAIDPRLLTNRAFVPRNTAAFTNREEFFSGVLRARDAGKEGVGEVIAWSTNPTASDCNGDGVPDGWSLYVTPPEADPEKMAHPASDTALTLDADGDGLTGQQEFANATFPANRLPGWTSKFFPTDPFNPDTDLDGLWDGDEGGALLIAAADMPTYDPDAAGDEEGATDDSTATDTDDGRNLLKFGGCDPTSMDTDGDGMNDAWEFRWMAVVANPDNPGSYMLDRSRPNPLYFNDGGLDYDGDGLTNYQEYLTGFLRQTRYDLGPSAARLYKDKLGQQDMGGLWSTLSDLPDVYSAMEDLGNPSRVPSVDYAFDVHPLIHALAQNAATCKEISSASSVAAAVPYALGSLWCRTLVVPEADDRLDNAAFETLRTAAQNLDIAYLRYLRSSGLETYRTVIYCLNQCEAAVVAFEKREARVNGWGDTAMTQLKTELRKLWNARARQIMFRIGGNRDTYHVTLQSLVKNLAEEEGREEVILDYEASTPLGGAADFVTAVAAGYDPGAYETQVAESPLPFVRSAYRRAIRGFNGGLWAMPTVSDYIDGRGESIVRTLHAGTALADGHTYLAMLAPLGYHSPILPAKAVQGGKSRIPGQFGNILDTLYLGGNLPITLNGHSMTDRVGYYDAFATTSPAAADSDLDGMDDYWEVFHGLNPILGAVSADDEDYNADTWSGSTYAQDKISSAYAPAMARGPSGIVALTGNVRAEGDNVFGNPALRSGSVSAYNYFAYPWMAGMPDADPDGDGLTNYQESASGQAATPRYGTDPSPLWFTDPENPFSFTARFYPSVNLNTTRVRMALAEGVDAPQTTVSAPIRPALGFPFVTVFAGGLSTGYEDGSPAKLSDAVLPYEINEGFDTDGDGVPDMLEISAAGVLSGDPQSLASPDRQYSAYLPGNGVMQSEAETRFGPQSLLTFTIECWIKPTVRSTLLDADETEVILVDRPWRFDNGGEGVTSQLRHNFQLGLKRVGDAATPDYKPFVRYTSAATGLPGEPVDGVPEVSPEAVAEGASMVLRPTENDDGEKVYEWTHLAATYDGKALVLYVNGEFAAKVASTLEPANGVIALHAYPDESSVTSYSYVRAPLLIGGAPTQAHWVADPMTLTGVMAFTDVYTSLYTGYIDEVRIWNGVRSATEIKEAMNSQLTETQMLTNRLEAFKIRYGGNGFYEVLAKPELVAYFSFNDLPAGQTAEGCENELWEKYPGQQTIGGVTTAGSFLYRRTAVEEMARNVMTGNQTGLYGTDNFPYTALEVFGSAYSRLPKIFRDDLLYGADDGTGSGNEFVPRARNRAAVLPAMDLERDSANLVVPAVHVNGSPKLKAPSAANANPLALTEDLQKPTDSEYWTLYASGHTVASSPVNVGVRTTGNPYAQRYVAAVTFDPTYYCEYPAYSMMPSADLMLLGGVYARVDAESWNGSPTTRPESAMPEAKPGADGNGLDWFEKDPNSTGSKGDEWLDANIANGAKDDADDDGMPSWWESYYGLDPNDPEGRNGPHGDNDGDFLTNYAEYLARSNPEVYSTAGNGVPDYQIPIWARRGRPTFGLLYTDNDFMEDHWEALYRHAMLTVDRNDAAADPDGDGWSNYAELRATVRGVRGTDPLASVAQTAPGLKAAYPTPVLLLEPAIFENLPADATTKNIVVQAYTAENNDSRPDATYVISLDSASGGTGGTGGTDGTDGTDGASAEQLVGSYALDQTVTGYLQPGNIVPGSLTFTGLRYIPISNEGDGGWTDDSTWTMRDNGAGAICAARAVANPDAAADATGEDAYIISEMEVGTIDYLTGAYAFRFDSKQWTGGYVDGADMSTTSLRAAYRYNSRAGLGSTFTLVTPTSGHLREGINNFFVFLDSNGDGQWNDGELAGVPDQHDVEVGWDKVTVPLRVTLTSLPPPGAIRVSLTDIANEIWGEAGEDLGDSENQGSSGTDTDSGSGAGSTGSGEDGETPRPPMDEKMEHELRIVAGSALSVASGTYGPTPLTGHTVFKKSYTRATAKPALTEDEIFAAYPQGLQGTESDNYVAVIYNVLLVPEYAKESTNEQAASYVVDTVTNYLTSIDKDKTVSTLDATGQFHNTDLVFTWKSNVQVPTFDLKIEKLEDGAGNTVSGTVFERTGIRGVGSAVQRTDGTYEYRYKLPRGIGEIGPSGVLFGNGLYRYTLTLKPYSGDPKPLTDTFRLVLKDSGRMTKEEPLIADAQDSFYVNLRVRYNGVLKERSDFGLKSRLVIEAHSSASFNGDPVASVSDYLVYDTVADNDDTNNVTAMIAANPYVTMTKDLQSDVGPDSGPAADAKFFSTCFDAELRALPDRQPVYLVAYLDLNGNGRRDAWEPWGYNTVGKDAANGFYFDPLAITPVKSGQTVQAEFYIQDVDTDNDKLADAWEWKQVGRLVTDFAEWHGDYTGTADNHVTDGAIWSNGRLTAFGAQLFGVDMTTAEALGSAAADYAEILGSDLSVLNGYDVYGLTVDTITLTPDGDLAIGWKMTADRIAADGSVAETVDLSEAFAGAAISDAVYTVYGKAGLADAAWTKIGTVTVGSGETSATLDQTQVGGNVFFKVILTTEKKAVQTLAD